MHRTLYFKKKIGIIVREETITVSSPVFFYGYSSKKRRKEIVWNQVPLKEML